MSPHLCAGLLCLSLAIPAAENGDRIPARPDPHPPRSYEADPPLPSPTPGDDGIRDPGEGTTPRPGFGPQPTPEPSVNDDGIRDAGAVDDDGIRDPGEATTPRPRPGVVQPGIPRDPTLGQDGIRDPGEGMDPRPRPGVMPEDAQQSHPVPDDDGIRTPGDENLAPRQPRPGAQPQHRAPGADRTPARGGTNSGSDADRSGGQSGASSGSGRSPAE